MRHWPTSQGDPRIKALARLHDTKLAVSLGDHAARQCFNGSFGDVAFRSEGGGTLWPDGLSAPDGTDDHVFAATNLGLASTNNIGIVVGVTVPSASESGAFLKLGDATSGIGVGIGNGSFDTPGNELIALLEGRAWMDRNVSIGTGFHTVGILKRREGSSDITHFYLDGASVSNASPPLSTWIQPSNHLFIGGYDASGAGGANRHTRCAIHFAVVAAALGQGESDHMNELFSAAASLYPPGVYTPWRRSTWVAYPGSASAAPTLSALSASNITPTGARHSVTLTF